MGKDLHLNFNLKRKKPCSEIQDTHIHHLSMEDTASLGHGPWWESQTRY